MLARGMLRASVLVIAALGAAASAQAQTLVCPQNLNFGKIAACNAAHDIVLSPLGGITAGGCLIAMGGHSAGRCSLSDVSDTATITMDPQAILDGPQSQQMNIDDFMLLPVGGGVADSALIITPDDAMDGFDFTIGGTLHVSGTQNGGAYNGLYSVTVHYQ